jgi:hypothetical protein
MLVLVGRSRKDNCQHRTIPYYATAPILGDLSLPNVAGLCTEDRPFSNVHIRQIHRKVANSHHKQTANMYKKGKDTRGDHESIEATGIHGREKVIIRHARGSE